MKKKIIFSVLSFVLLFSITILFDSNNLYAADCGGYLVTGGGKDGVCHGNYEAAKTDMNSRTSNETTTPVISRNSVIIDAKHAIVKFKNRSGTFNVYTEPSLASAYTYLHPAYGSEAAFLDYSIAYGTVKVKISGYTGWVNLSDVTIIPLSNFYGNNVTVVASGCNLIRNHYSTDALVLSQICQGDTVKYSNKQVSGGYTWYQVTFGSTTGWVANDGSWLKENSTSSIKSFYEHWGPTGNLIHYYGYYTSDGVETNTYTNLGPAPSYLTKKANDYDVANNYYSFDGNYFYKSLFNMLDDYKAGTYSRSVNASTPHFPYYMYLPNHTKTGYTAADFDQIIKDRGYNSYNESRMYGQGTYFIESQNLYGVNALLTFAAAINESATGTSAIAKDKNNLFGHGAYDSCAYSCATVYPSVRDSILAHARMTGDGFNSPSDWRYFGSHYGNKQSGMGVKYASDPYWGEKAANNAYTQDKKYGMQDYMSNTIGVKLSNTDVPIKKTPSDSAATIYTLKNNSFSVSNIPVVVFDSKVVNGVTWYKVYTDAPLDDNQNVTTGYYSFDKSYGWVKGEHLYIQNKQPNINGTKNLTVNYGSSLNLLSGITATDTEDGNLAVTVTGSVDTNKPGAYTITYNTVDSARFERHVTVTVTVLPPKELAIYAENQTINLNTTFNPKANIKAIDSEGNDITSLIVITANTVDITKEGDYAVTYKVTDTKGNTITKTIIVKVVDKDLVLKTSEYHFNKMEIVDDKLKLTGYHIISGINHKADSNINHTLLLRNQSGITTKIPLTKITDKSKMPFIIESPSGLDYTYAWFEGYIDIDDLDVSDYTLLINTRSDDYYAEKFVTNLFGAKMPTTHETNEKSVLVRNNFDSTDRALQLVVRESNIVEKTANPRYNIYNAYRTISVKNNKLYLKGTSYMIGGNYSNTTNVDRKIVLENTETFKRYEYSNVGFMNKGDYLIELVTSDGFSKERAWYETEIDVSKLEVGEYVIYVATSSNIADYGEIQDRFAKTISTKFEVNGKTYSFKIDKNNRYRLIMEVK